MEPGPFRIRVPLGPFWRERPADYVGLRIRCEGRDEQDRAWRTESLRLVPARGAGLDAD